MGIEAKIIKDSIGPDGTRLTTFLLKYPRFIHAEMLTHREFSRNASSSRATPVKKSIEMIEADMAIPLAFGKNKAGMQSEELIEDQDAARKLWIKSGKEAIKYAKKMSDLDIHKQFANRILEPYSHITVVVSSTGWNNFLALRDHSAAQPEIQELARRVRQELQGNIPKELSIGEWHLPFVEEQEIEDLLYKNEVSEYISNDFWLPLIKKSVARCARVSYLNHEGKLPTEEEDFKLYDRLLGAQPIHASPAEHQARSTASYVKSGNFTGWVQYRKLLEGEYIE